MEILTNKQITDLVYKVRTSKGERIEVIKNGEIIQVSELISPMRGGDMGLSKREPHVTFYNGSQAEFIPIDDILNINYA